MDLNWKEYRLVKKGESHLSRDVMHYEKETPEETNEDKDGSFEFLESFIEYGALLETIRKAYMHLIRDFSIVLFPFTEEMRA
jgi:hypothetical protein